LINSFDFILILGMNMRSSVSIYARIPNQHTSYCYNCSLHKLCKNILLLLCKAKYDNNIVICYTIYNILYLCTILIIIIYWLTIIFRKHSNRGGKTKIIYKCWSAYKIHNSQATRIMYVVWSNCVSKYVITNK